MRARLSHYQFIAVASQTPHSGCAMLQLVDHPPAGKSELYGIYHAHGGGSSSNPAATAMWAPENGRDYGSPARTCRPGVMQMSRKALLPLSRLYIFDLRHGSHVYTDTSAATQSTSARWKRQEIINEQILPSADTSRCARLTRTGHLATRSR